MGCTWSMGRNLVLICRIKLRVSHLWRKRINSARRLCSRQSKHYSVNRCQKILFNLCWRSRRNSSICLEDSMTLQSRHCISNLCASTVCQANSRISGIVISKSTRWSWTLRIVWGISWHPAVGWLFGRLCKIILSTTIAISWGSSSSRRLQDKAMCRSFTTAWILSSQKPPNMMISICWKLCARLSRWPTNVLKTTTTIKAARYLHLKGSNKYIG